MGPVELTMLKSKGVSPNKNKTERHRWLQKVSGGGSSTEMASTLHMSTAAVQLHQLCI
jgi:hypothetical protein